MLVFNNTTMMMRTLFKRDWVKFILWVIALIAFAASGVGKLEVAITPVNQASMYSLFNGPALVSLFGPTLVTGPKQFTGAAAFGSLMPLITVMVFAIITIVYVVNRTRKDEEEGIAELLRSFQIGKLANTTALVIELFVLQLFMTFLLAGSIQVQGAAGMGIFTDNLLFSSTITSQSFMWGMLALLLAQIFPESGSAKGNAIGLFFVLYIVRMGTDISNESLSWLNPLSWCYLTGVYVEDNWLPIALTLALSLFALIISYILELKRDLAAGYIQETRGKAHAGHLLHNFTGLVFHQQRTSIFVWILGLFVLGITYGSMTDKIGSLVGGASKNNYVTKILSITSTTDSALMEQEFLGTVYLVLALISSCFAIASLFRMISEERKNRQEQIYSMPISRFKVYLNYVAIAWGLGALAQFSGIFGLYLSQQNSSNVISASKIFESGLAWVFGIFFILSLLSLLIAFLPRSASLIWVYMAVAFFIGIIGKLLDFPNWVLNINIFNNLMKLPSSTVMPNTPNWSVVMYILLIALLFTVIGLVGYRRRDLISE
ncbi:ABC transporter permease [Lactovum miscens]|uniref:ABC-2 type transport system permease protein n=1 Tax=Lactovum miscens TaxID=190387 RepID=A0A841C9U7_9LACT|nr:ABC transporter permease [Lactovum miscens]MBB5888169.1 ABC-2 type transport system permease protein [Lactovum miscens]